MSKKALPQSTVATDNIQNQPNIVKDQAAQLKLSFDQYGIDSKTYNNNELLPALANEDLNNSGSNTIGHNSPNILANNSGDALEELAEKILQVISDGIAPGVPGYYLRTTEDGLSVEWAEVDDTKWVRPVTDNQIAIDELAVKADVDFIIGKDGETYYDYASSGKKRTSGTVDFGFVFAATINQGTNTIEISSLIKAKNGSTPSLLSDCFTVGEEITLANDTQRELFKITNIDDGTATITLNANITLTYATGANVYRSNLTVNGDVWEFGGFSSQETIDKTTPVEVIGTAESTQGNGGRKDCVLDNGWVVAVYSKITGNTSLRVEIDRQDGNGFVASGIIGQTADDWAITSFGNYFVVGIVDGSSAYYSVTDAESIVGEPTLTFTNFGDTFAGGVDKCSIDVNEFGGKNKITFAFTAKFSTHTNSFNVGAYQGTISNGVVTWGSVEQVTTTNTSGQDEKSPSVVYRNTDDPFIIYYREQTGGHAIKLAFKTGSWNTGNLYLGGTYTHSNPSATFMPPSVATKINASYTSGLIIVSWDGKDATDTSKLNIRCRASSDGGATWFDFGVTNEKVTSGNVNDNRQPSISWNNDGDVFIMFDGDDGAWFQIRQIERNVSTGYGSVVDITSTAQTHFRCNSVNNFHDFDKPLTIWQNTGDADVKFYGKWTVGSLTPVTEIDIRINVEAREDKKQITAFLETNDFDTVTLDGALSIRASGADEVYVDTTDTKVDEGTNNMYMSVGSVTTGAKLATMKYNLTRANTSDNVQIRRVQGGIAA